MVKDVVAMPTPVVVATVDEAPRKKRRTLRDAEKELEICRVALKEARRKLIVTARENAKMKVLLMKYIDKDDSLLSTSQLSVADSQSTSQPTAVGSDTAATATPSTVVFSSSSSGLDDDDHEEGESENSSLWTSDFSADAATDSFVPVSQLSQLSQVSQWSELSSTSNLDEIINFLEKQDFQENERVTTLEADLKELKEIKTVVRVGVGVLLTSPEHPQCVLIGARKGSHGEGKFALPGGHLEMYESWKECAMREVKEEVDLDLEDANVTFAYVTNDPMEDDDKHYITIFMQAPVPNGQVPRNMEPHKCDGWRWVPWDTLRQRENLFVPLWHITRSDFRPTLLGKGERA